MVNNKQPYRSYALLLFVSVLLFACGKNEGSSSSISENDEASESTTVSSSNGECILSYQSKYDELLTLEDIQKHFKGDMSEATKKYDMSKNEKYRNNDTYTYAWKSDRTQTVAFNNNKMTIPVNNQIGLHWVGDDLYHMWDDKSPRDNFHTFYRNASQEELDRAMAIASEQVQKMEGVSEEQANVATDMAKGLSAKTRFKNVEGVGDAAAWVVQENRMVVLAGDVTFQVIADVGGEEAERIELAKKLALEVLKKCN